MQLISPWAPNVHPMIVHFPIVLVSLAAVADLIHLVRPRARGLEAIAPLLYLLGALSAVSAYVSGRLAATAVFTPGMAHGLVDDHKSWALATMSCFVLVAVLRLGVRFTDRDNSRGLGSSSWPSGWLSWLWYNRLPKGERAWCTSRVLG